MTHADQSPAQPQGAQEQKCVWHIDDVGGDSVWESACKHAFEFNDGGPIENGFKFCGYCGGSLIESRSSEDDERGNPEGGPEDRGLYAQ